MFNGPWFWYDCLNALCIFKNWPARECAKTALFVWFSIHDIMVFVVILVRPLLFDGFIVSIVCNVQYYFYFHPFRSPLIFCLCSIALLSRLIRRLFIVNRTQSPNVSVVVVGFGFFVVVVFLLFSFWLCTFASISKRYFLTKCSVADYFTKNFYFQFPWSSLSLRIVIIVCLVVRLSLSLTPSVPFIFFETKRRTRTKKIAFIQRNGV